MNARKQYLEEVGKEYQRADQRGRGRLLDEAEKRTGLNRKYLIRVLNHPQRQRPRKRRRRRAAYGAVVVTALIEVWDIFEQPCGQRMVAVLRSELDRLRKLGELRCSETVAGQLQQISASTIDRLLGREKRIRQLRRNRNPNVQRLIYQKVPVKVAADWDTSEIGNVQVDFVAHCGRSTGGDYIHTISAVDIATNWWEGQAIAVRCQQATKERLLGPHLSGGTLSNESGKSRGGPSLQHRNDNGGTGSVYAGLAQLFRFLRNAGSAGGSYSLGPTAIAGSFVAAVENTASSPGSPTGTGGPTATGKQYGRQWPWPLVSRTGQSSLCGAF